ncbi:shikimate dehydrogenase [Parvularcula sp. ZS-1/3]|uniref:Shikimate dehydrogenase (NADP(+)) n=1 Tax=Parvularcula mediterranea TaxID=2732508 RepID=A0A7Y3RKI6_9PROT|nr:shikimate dehydrogenase [Parvularcula mediterranea]NNU15739.1 shikimate dehydrogenase [Parvularcula mediterranea]
MVMKAAVLGHPVSQSLSPRIFNEWFDAVGFPGEYEAIDTPPDAFEETVRRLMAEGYAGVNVTLPHKNVAASLADFRNKAVERCGAANLLLFRSGKIIADNTDGAGFARCLVRRDKPGASLPSKAVVLGAGGAASPVINQLTPQRVHIANRTKAKAEALAENFGPSCSAHDWDEIPELLKGADLLVNTTSLGMKGQPTLDIDLAPMSPDALVVDIVYAPLQTELLKQARKLGLGTSNGLTMLVYQAVPSFLAYTGLRAPSPEKTLRALEAEKR